MGCERLDGFGRHAALLELGFDFGDVAALHQRLALGEAVGEQDLVVVRVGPGRLGRDQEVHRHDLRALVQQLEEGVLAVGAGFAPHDRAGGEADGAAIDVHRLAVALHVELLEVGREAAEALVVGNYGLGREAQGVAVPHADQPHQHGDVGLQRRFAEMLVHLEPAAQKILELLRADQDGEREPDAGPDGIAPADPVPEAEHAVGLDAELGHEVELGRHGREMVLHGAFAEPVGDPCPRGCGVGHGFERREGLGRDDEQGRGWVQARDRVADVGAVHVGHEMAPDPLGPVGRERARRHGGPEVRAADADVDHVRDGPPRRAGQRAVADAGREGRHLLAFGDDVGHDVAAVDQHGLARHVAQGRVQGRAVLGRVDDRAGEHAVPPAFEVGVAGQLEERLQHGVVDAVLGIIEHEVAERDVVALEPLRIAREQVGERRGRRGVGHLFQGRQARSVRVPGQGGSSLAAQPGARMTP